MGHDKGMQVNSSVDNMGVVEMSVGLAVAWAANPNNRASPDEVVGFLRSAHGALTVLSDASSESKADEPAAAKYTRAVTPRASLASREHIISMIDGKPYKSLRRHLSGHGLTPEEYRERYGLPRDYPMVAPEYSEKRSALAKAAGLGRKPGQKVKKAKAV